MAHLAEIPPLTVVEPVVERLHGVELVDPYRWLEDQQSERTRNWLAQQEAYVRPYLASLPGRSAVRSRVAELLAAPVVSEPWMVGDQCFFLKRCDESEQPAIVVRNEITGRERTVVDPRSVSGDDATAVAICAVSESGRFLAYLVRQGGTDHAAVQILDLRQERVLTDGLPDGFCTGFVFAPDDSGFYYSHRALRDSRPDYKAAFWHRLGTDRSADEELFCAGEAADRFLGILASNAAGLLAYVTVTAGSDPATSIHLQRMESGAKVTLLLNDIGGCFVPFFAGSQLLALTDAGAPNLRIVGIDLVRPDTAHWRDIVPESDRRIQQFAASGGKVFVTRVDQFKTRIEAFGIADGKREEVPICAERTLDLMTPTVPGNTLFYTQTSLTEAPAVYRYRVEEKRAMLWQESGVAVDPSRIAVEEVSYPSKDGTSIPLFLAARKEAWNSGPLATFLTGYGGFGSCVTPRFSAFATFLVEQGMLFAVPALRGGAELGENWHRAGKRASRQNSFDDFIAAAEWLLAQGLAANGRIAIGGGSNAGLLVGAAITQRPDLFRAAICLGPLLDMTRYHLFDLAAAWAEEYGSPEDEQDFHSLLSYSPYHHVQCGTEYPAVLLISGDADTRCNPMHARKMTARLQAANRSQYPILLDYKPAWGHTPVQPRSVRIESLTDRLAFVCHELGVEVQNWRPS